MSFEGTYQILCNNGHLYYEDVYAFDESLSKCPICGYKPVWFNLIDQTNDEGIAVELRIKEKVEYCKCDKCNFEHIAKHQTYYIPENQGTCI